MGHFLYLLLIITIPAFCFSQNSVDAVTSASENIRVDSGYAYEDSVVLYTYAKDSYDNHFINYGTTEEYGTIVDVDDIPYEHRVVLADLTPGTTYHFLYRGELSTNPEEENHGVTGTFTTVEASSISGTPVVGKNRSELYVLDGNLILNETVTPGDHILLYDASGRVVYSALVSMGIGNAIPLKEVASGNYIVQHRSIAGVTTSSKVTID